MFIVIIDEVFVNLVGNDIKIMLQYKVCNPFQFIKAYYASSRIARTVKNNCFSVWSDLFFYQVCFHIEIICICYDRDSSRKLYLLAIAHPIRLMDDEFISWIC